VLGLRGYGFGGVPARGGHLGEVTHTCVFWHYFITGRGLVWDNPFESPPDDYFLDGYACMVCEKQGPQ